MTRNKLSITPHDTLERLNNRGGLFKNSGRKIEEDRRNPFNE